MSRLRWIAGVAMVLAAAVASPAPLGADDAGTAAATTPTSAVVATADGAGSGAGVRLAGPGARDVFFGVGIGF